MYKLKLIFIIFSLTLISACSTHSNLAPVESIPKANNNDLTTMTDCKIINENIVKTEQAIANYKKSKSLNTSANVLSGIASVLSLGTDKVDYVSNDDLNATIKSYEERKASLDQLHHKYCTNN